MISIVKEGVFMNKNDRDFLNRIFDEIDNENTQLPETLKGENIVGFVKGHPQTQKHFPYKRLIAAAASLVVVLLAVMTGTRLYSPVAEPLSNDKSDYVYTASDYEEIENFFIGIRKEIKAQNKSWQLFEQKSEMIQNSESTLVGSSAADTQSTETDFGKTDLQVAGVDEADIIKNDGKYLYVVCSGENTVIKIIDVQNPKDMKTVSTIKIADNGKVKTTIQQIYLKDNKLIAIAYQGTEPEHSQSDEFSDAVCCYAGTQDGKYLAAVYDITNPADPIKLNSYSIDGNGVSSRLIGNRLLLVSNYMVPLFDDTDKLREACVPSYYVNDEKQKLPVDDINVINGNDQNTYAVVMLIDLSQENAVPECSAVLGGSSEIYCNNNSLFLSAYYYEPYEDGREVYSYDRVHTRIYRFDVSDGVTYKCMGQADGEILNQFSMDEYDGRLRLATTTEDSGCKITVFDKDLNVVGTLDGIAKGERIYAVRFIEKTAYAVTFLQTDPLFVIDLSDPTAPSVTGELKIPGFSNMLFPYSENYIIGVGKDGTQSGASTNLKISLFDVSDPKNPKESAKAVVDSNSFSLSQDEHKAFITFSDGSFAIPVSIYDGDGGTRSYLLRMNVENGKFVLSGKYTASDSTDEVKRGTYIDNTVFTLGEQNLNAFDKTNGNILGNIRLTDGNHINSPVVTSGEVKIY